MKCQTSPESKDSFFPAFISFITIIYLISPNPSPHHGKHARSPLHQTPGTAAPISPHLRLDLTGSSTELLAFAWHGQPRSPAGGHSPTHTKNIKEQDIDSGCLQSPGLGCEPEPARQPRPQLIAHRCPAALAALPASSAQRQRLRDLKTRSGVRSFIYRRIAASKGSEPRGWRERFPIPAAPVQLWLSPVPACRTLGIYQQTAQGQGRFLGGETEARLPSGWTGVRSVDSSKKKSSRKGGKT